jgi:O-methyltransferase
MCRKAEDVKNIVIFGAGALGKTLCTRLSKTASVVMVDNDSAKWGGNVLPPSKLHDIDYDVVFVAVFAGLDAIREQLINELSVPESKIVNYYSRTVDDIENILSRIIWLEGLSEYMRPKNIEGSIAEVGVYKGDFSHHINRLFPDRRLYLFDTFEGYDERDFAAEKANNEMYDEFTAGMKAGPKLSDTSVELVFSKLPNPQNAVIKKGYFPSTFNLKDEAFSFVFLDLNLYQPTIEGLKIFYPLMSKGGVILVHDYFYGTQNGVYNAVNEFMEAMSISAVPAADNTAIAIVKN